MFRVCNVTYSVFRFRHSLLQLWETLDDLDIGGHPSTPLTEHLHNMFVVEVLLTGKRTDRAEGE